MNLLKETQDDIAASGHTPEQIVFIGSEESGHQCSWQEFCALADHEYDSGTGKYADDRDDEPQDGSQMTTERA